MIAKETDQALDWGAGYELHPRLEKGLQHRRRAGCCRPSKGQSGPSSLPRTSPHSSGEEASPTAPGKGPVYNGSWQVLGQPSWLETRTRKEPNMAMEERKCQTSWSSKKASRTHSRLCSRDSAGVFCGEQGAAGLRMGSRPEDGAKHRAGRLLSRD